MTSCPTIQNSISYCDHGEEKCRLACYDELADSESPLFCDSLCAELCVEKAKISRAHSKRVMPEDPVVDCEHGPFNCLRTCENSIKGPYMVDLYLELCTMKCGFNWKRPSKPPSSPRPSPTKPVQPEAEPVIDGDSTPLECYQTCEDNLKLPHPDDRCWSACSKECIWEILPAEHGFLERPAPTTS